MKNTVVFMLNSEIMGVVFFSWPESFIHFFFVSMSFSSETNRKLATRLKTQVMMDKVLFPHVSFLTSAEGKHFITGIFDIRTRRSCSVKSFPALWSHAMGSGSQERGDSRGEWLWICKIHIINKLSIIHTCSSISHLCRHLFSCSTDKSPPEALCCFWPVGSSSCELRQSHQQLLNCFLQWTWAKALWDKIRRILAILMSFSVQPCCWEEIFTYKKKFWTRIQWG